MNIYLKNMSAMSGLALMFCLAVLAQNTAMGAGNKVQAGTIDTGYSVLKLFLRDEQRLTTIRRAKMVLTFSGISDHSTALIDEIADSSEQALGELDELAAAKPTIKFEEFSDDSIGKATLDSLRITTARDFLFNTVDFEKNLLLSQSQILRVISHLARELEEKESNATRKAWLNSLADRYEDYYKQVYAMLSVATADNA